jgi:hypothetical protein
MVCSPGNLNDIQAPLLTLRRCEKEVLRSDETDLPDVGITLEPKLTNDVLDSDRITQQQQGLITNIIHNNSDTD